MSDEYDDVIARFSIELDDAPSVLRPILLAMSSFAYAAVLTSDDEDALRSARTRFSVAYENYKLATAGLAPTKLLKLRRKSLKSMLRLYALSPFGEQLFKPAPPSASPAPIIRETICSWLTLLETAVQGTDRDREAATVDVPQVKMALQALNVGEQDPLFTAAKGKKGSAKRRLSVARERYIVLYSKKQLAKGKTHASSEINQFIVQQCNGCYSPDRIRKWQKTSDATLSKQQKRTLKKDVKKRISRSEDKVSTLFNELGGALRRLQEASSK